MWSKLWNVMVQQTCRMATETNEVRYLESESGYIRSPFAAWDDWAPLL